MSPRRAPTAPSDPAAEPNGEPPAEPQEVELSAEQAELDELHALREQIIQATEGKSQTATFGAGGIYHSSSRDVWLWQKLAALIERLPAVSKDGKFMQKTKTGDWVEKYRFVSQGQVMALLGKRMAAIGLVTVPEIINHHVAQPRDDDDDSVHVVVEMREWLVDVDTGQRIPFEWFGEAADWGDKATQKAGTVGDKYWLMKLTSLTDFRDPDAENPTEEAQERPRRSTSRSDGQGSSQSAESEQRLDDLAELLAYGQSVGRGADGKQKPNAPSWFPAKIKARVKFHSGTTKQSDTMSEEEFRKGATRMAEEIQTEHRQFCGDSCDHRLLLSWYPRPEVVGVDPAQDSQGAPSDG